MFINPSVIALVGKLGHGKTYLLNKVTGSNFPSDAGGKSCTRQLQFGYTKKNDIVVVDTPGFYASDDIAAHLAAQKLALEGTKLSGIFIVVKYGRADEIAETADKIMGFLGENDVRLIITNKDVVCNEKGFNSEELKKQLSHLLDLSSLHMLVVGKQTNFNVIESFIKQTLHEPREFHIGVEQIALLSSLSTGTRKINKPIHEAYAKIAAASKECESLVKCSRTLESDTAILAIQKMTEDSVLATKGKIFREAYEGEISTEQQNLIYGKAGLSLSLALKKFVSTTNAFLSWDVTDVADTRNHYKKCNFCGAVYNKTEGCDGETVCGAVPADIKRQRPMLIAEFKLQQKDWIVQYFWEGIEMQVHCVLHRLRSLNRRVSSWGGNKDHTKSSGSAIESGCGASISWSSMIPVDDDLVKALGQVELCATEPLEVSSRVAFDKSMQHHTKKNKKIFKDFLH